MCKLFLFLVTFLGLYSLPVLAHSGFWLWLVSISDEGSLPEIMLSGASKLASTYFSLFNISVHVLYTEKWCILSQNFGKKLLSHSIYYGWRQKWTSKEWFHIIWYTITRDTWFCIMTHELFKYSVYSPSDVYAIVNFLAQQCFIFSKWLNFGK